LSGAFVEILRDAVGGLPQLLLERADRQLRPELGRRVAGLAALEARPEDGALLGQDLAAGEEPHVQVVDVGDQQVRVVVFDLEINVKILKIFAPKKQVDFDSIISCLGGKNIVTLVFKKGPFYGVKWRKSSKLLAGMTGRVTRLGEFSPVGWLFTLGSFFRNY
jgi:hypothetical protein